MKERVGEVWTGGRTDEWTWGRSEPIKELKVHREAGANFCSPALKIGFHFYHTK